MKFVKSVSMPDSTREGPFRLKPSRILASTWGCLPKGMAYAITALVVLPAWMVVYMAGCTPIDWPLMGGVGSRSEFKIEPQGNRDVAVLNADDVVAIMRRAGFSDDQILALGAELRDTLQNSGAAQIKKRKVEVTFAVRGEYLFITTRLRGNDIYDLKEHKFGIAPSSLR